MKKKELKREIWILLAEETISREQYVPIQTVLLLDAAEPSHDTAKPTLRFGPAIPNTAEACILFP